jgi:hypothetical protein
MSSVPYTKLPPCGELKKMGYSHGGISLLHKLYENNPLIMKSLGFTSEYSLDIPCKVCSNNEALEICDSCGNSICLSSRCIEQWHHINNSKWNICSNCHHGISRKFKIYIEDENDVEEQKQVEELKKITKLLEEQ